MLRAGSLTDITHPKILVMYLSVLPQFLRPGSPTAHALLLAYAVAVLGSLWLLVVALFVHRIRHRLVRGDMRRLVDTAAVAALLGFGARPAAE